jgi:hypothetical protein
MSDELIEEELHLRRTIEKIKSNVITIPDNINDATMALIASLVRSVREIDTLLAAVEQKPEDEGAEVISPAKSSRRTWDFTTRLSWRRRKHQRLRRGDRSRTCFRWASEAGRRS